MEVKAWNSIDTYKDFKNFVTKIDVVNDRAEGGINLIQEYIVSAHSESDLQDLLIVVKENRSSLPYLNKVLLKMSN